MASTKISTAAVAKIAKLANLSISPSQEALFADQFSTTIEVINRLNEIDTAGVPPTSQVNHLENVTRSDKIEPDRVLSQAEALANAPQTHAGFFVVKQILQKDSE